MHRQQQGGESRLNSAANKHKHTCISTGLTRAKQEVRSQQVEGKMKRDKDTFKIKPELIGTLSSMILKSDVMC